MSGFQEDVIKNAILREVRPIPMARISPDTSGIGLFFASTQTHALIRSLIAPPFFSRHPDPFLLKQKARQRTAGLF